MRYQALRDDAPQYNKIDVNPLMGQRRQRAKDVPSKANFSGVQGGGPPHPYSYPCENYADS